MTDAGLIEQDKGYQARGIVARIAPMGHYVEGLVKKQIFRYLTLDVGSGPSIAVMYDRPAPFLDTPDGRVLDTRDLKEGEIVVAPGFVYKKIKMSSPLMTEHLKALRSYRPKDIITEDTVRDEAIDLGEINKPKQ